MSTNGPAYPDHRGGPSPTPALGPPEQTSPGRGRLGVEGDIASAIRLLVAEEVAAQLAALELDRAAPAEDGWMTAREAAAYLRLSVDALHRLTARRDPDGIPFGQDTPGGKLWFKRSDLDEWRRR